MSGIAFLSPTILTECKLVQVCFVDTLSPPALISFDPPFAKEAGVKTKGRYTACFAAVFCYEH